MAKVKQVSQYSVIDEVMDTDTKFKVNGWYGLASEIVDEKGAQGVNVFFPGVSYKQLKKKK